MKLIFKVDGSDFLTDKDPVAIPQIGWSFKWANMKFKVIDVEIDCDIPKEEETLIIHLQNELKKEVKEVIKQVQVRKVWTQNEGNLTIDKCYEIIDQNDRYFTIIDDKGKVKKYQNRNFQFRHL